MGMPLVSTEIPWCSTDAPPPPPRPPPPPAAAAPPALPPALPPPSEGLLSSATAREDWDPAPAPAPAPGRGGEESSRTFSPPPPGRRRRTERNSTGRGLGTGAEEELMLTRRHFLSFFCFFRGGQRSNGDGREGGREGGREDRRCGLFGGTAHTRAQVIWKGIGTSEHRHIAAHRTHPASSMRPCPASASLLQGNPRPRRQPGKRKKKNGHETTPTPTLTLADRTNRVLLLL